MIKTISPNEVKNILEQEFFDCKWDKAFHFLPAELCDWAILSNFKISKHDIDKWEDFEFGRIDFEIDDFRDLIFNNEYPKATEVLFISEESLIKGKAFSFTTDDFDNFATFYENTFVMSFFQPLDYIVYFRDQKEIKIIHHDGNLLKINKAESNQNQIK